MAIASSSNNTAVSKISREEDCICKMEFNPRLLRSMIVQSRLGQTVLKLVDNFLWTVEKCMEWSLPRQDVRGDGKDSGKPELVRPLPWILFLPSLVMLRIIRVTVNIGATILSYPTITPSEMIRRIQTNRRCLKAAMKKRTKDRYDTKDKRPLMSEAKKALIKSIRLTLSSLSCLDSSKPSLSPPPTKIYVNSILDPDSVTTTSEEKSSTESMDPTAKVKEDSSESEEEEKEETLNEKIDRLALESSEDDEDFDPAKCPSSDTNSDEEDDENSDDGNVSLNEIHDVYENAELLNKNLKNKIEQFLNAEQTWALAPEQESDEPTCGKRSSAEESRDKVEERLAVSERIDSPECYTSDKSSQEGDPTFYSPISSDSDAPKEFSASSMSIAEQSASRKNLKTNEFANGEARFISTSTNSESKSSEQTNNGAVVEKRSTNVSKSHKGKRASHGNRKKK